MTTSIITFVVSALALLPKTKKVLEENGFSIASPDGYTNIAWILQTVAITCAHYADFMIDIVLPFIVHKKRSNYYKSKFIK